MDRIQMMLATLAIAGALLTSCTNGTGSAPAPTSTVGASPAPDVTIRQGKDGRAQVDGAPLHGDPKDCAAFKKCCASPPSSDFGLMCGMAQASHNGDCTKALADVRAYAKESKKPGACK